MTRRNFALNLLTSSAALASSQQKPLPRKPNVVVFLVDDMGYADLSSYGSKDIKTPHIDRLAREGAKFTNFYSNGPVCTPTRAALMTGRYQQRVGLEWAIPPGRKEPGLETKEISLARLLKNQGYATALFGKWHLGYKPEFSPNAHGFDKFFGILSGNVDHYSHREINGEPDLYEDGKPVTTEGYLTDLLADKAESWIEANQEQPFFLYFAFNSVHWPFQAPNRQNDVRTRETWFNGTRKDYGLMLQEIDAAVGRVLNLLDKRGLAKDTLVVFTNDNGGERLSDNSPFFHHKGTLWEGGIRVPALLRWPGQVPAKKVIDTPALTMDLTATISSAVDAHLPEGRAFDGVNLLPVITGKQAAPDRTLFWRINRPSRNQKAARRGQWKYISDAGIEQLFDLTSDPGERHDLTYHNPEKTLELKKAVRQWEAEVDKTKPAYQVL